MKLPLPATLRKIKDTFSVVVFGSAFFFLPYLAAVMAETPLVPSPSIPYEYGKVIYQKDGNQDQHLYIICQSHRNATTGTNGRNTAKVQAEIYRIGEWLIRNEQIELLLPEGFFRKKGGGKQAATMFNDRHDANERQPAYSLDDQTLKKLLNDTTTFAKSCESEMPAESFPVITRAYVPETLQRMPVRTEEMERVRNGGV